VNLATEGPAAPPRANGELLFAAPWESRAFGMVAALHEAGAFTWPDFQQALVRHIGAPGDRPYYEDWLAALEEVTGLAHETDTRADHLSHRTPGHDHP
jgi:nitrile hydratase accessory protein